MATLGQPEIQKHEASVRFSVWQTGFWRAYLVQMRPYLLFVSGITGLAGLAITGDASLIRTALAGVAFFFSYGFGQALTDCFQMDTDEISSPYRPLVRGEISRRSVLRTSLSGLVFCAAILVWSNFRIIPLAIAGVIGLATYTPFKKRWWGGPFYNALIVVALYLMGCLSASHDVQFNQLNTAGVWAIGALVFFGYGNFVLAGYFKDVSADRQTGYETFPVRFGFRAAAIASHAFALGTLVSFGVWLAGIQFGWHSTPGVALGIWAVAILLNAQGTLHGVSDDKQAHIPIQGVVRSYVYLLSSVMLLANSRWLPFLFGFLVAFEMILNSRPDQHQI